jgi:hypothetical protein
MANCSSTELSGAPDSAVAREQCHSVSLVLSMVAARHPPPPSPTPEGHAPRVEGVPSSKTEISPALADSGTPFGRGPGHWPRNQNAFLGRLHAQDSTRLAFDPPQASLKLLPIKWSRGLYALFPRLKSPAAEAPSFGYFALRESELFAGGFDTLRETSFFGHSCSGHCSIVTPSGRLFAQEVYAEA